MKKREAIQAIHRHGMLLVFPLDNRPEPLSLWHVAYPRSRMRWEWDDAGDKRVATLWHLREELSLSRRVIYSKWFRGRATLFSFDLFRALLSAYSRQPGFPHLTRDAREILALLEESSPLSTKVLKRGTNLVGRALEPSYNKALQQLWERLLIVAFGEVDEGAFPSLAVGATRLLFEELYQEALELSPDDAEAVLAPHFRRQPLLAKQHAKILQKLAQPLHGKTPR